MKKLRSSSALVGRKMSGTESKGWTPLDEVFVYRLKTLHSILAPLVHDSLRDKLASDKAFKKRYEDWVRKQGWTLDEERQSNVANQAAYILINKILFYKALERKKDLPLLTKAENVSELLKVLRTCFDKALKIDYKAVFQRDPIYDEIPLTLEVANILNIIIEEVSEYDLAGMKRDIIGTLYEKLLPADERHDLGQYYTPPQIVELIVRLCVENPDDRVLDPACGSGGFLVESYRRLLQLKGKETPDNETHQELLNQIWGVDINKFPAHLATINLATQNLESKSDFVNVIVSDFFDIREPDQRVLAPWSGVTPDGKREIIKIPRFNVVVANPPYIRQEDITDKRKVREHLRRLSRQKMTARSDIYCYFFTHSREFLREGGKIGFVTSDRWLDVGYGKDLQEFFLDNFKIRAIITFDKKVFDEPMIGSCVTILEECSDKKLRDRHFVNFLRIKKRMDMTEIVEKAQTSFDSEAWIESEKYRLMTKKQCDLRKEKKWNQFLFAPKIFFDVLNHNNICRLEEVAEIKRGITCGANEFFYFKTKSEVQKWGLKDFVVPLLKGIGQVKYLKLTKEDTEWYILDVHNLVEDILKDASKLKCAKSRDLSNVVKQALKAKGLKELVEYIERGEKEGVHERPTCKSRKVWFDLGDIKKSVLISSACYWKEFPILYNVGGVAIDHYFYHISPFKGIEPKVLAGILNSTLTRLFIEISGRIAKGQALDRITIMVYETKNLRIPDPRKMSIDDKRRISSAFEDILKRERHCDDEERAELQRKLDVAVLKTLGMEDRLEELHNAVESLLQRRIKGGAEQTEVLVGPEIVREELADSKELEEIVELLQLSKIGQITEEQKIVLGQRAGKIVRDIAYELIKLNNEPMLTKEITAKLLNIEDKILKLAGYFDVIKKVMGRKVLPSQVIRDLVDIWRDRPEGIERTISRLLSADNRLLKIEPHLFGLSEWTPNQLLQIYVRLASEYRISDPEKKEMFIKEAISLLESGEAKFPNKDALIKTLRRL